MRTQVVMTAPRKIVVGKYLTPKGVRLKSEGASKETLLKYTKNRLAINPASQPFTHQVINAQGQLIYKQRHIKHIK